mgnify:CR=1 FL=1
MSDPEGMLKKISEAVAAYETEKTEELVNKALKGGLKPATIIENGLTPGIREVGERFGRGEAFLPELIMAAAAMKSAMKILEPEILKSGTKVKSCGRVLIGTVAGDLHDIGKNIVVAMLQAAQFEVIDLGVDVSCEAFIQKVAELKPNILGLSALLTTTKLAQREVVDALKKAGLRNRVRVMIGGAAVDQEWAREIGADAYAENAVEAVQTATFLMETKGKGTKNNRSACNLKS